MSKLIHSLFIILHLCLNAVAQEINYQAISTLQPENYEQLAFLKNEIGDAQIVFLGEQDHGDGGAMLAKTMLTKFLIQDMGFSVIAFEGDLITLNDSTLSLDEKWDKLAGIWKNSDQMIPLYNFLKSSNITLSGFDLFGSTGFNDFKAMYWDYAADLTQYTQAEVNIALNAIFFDKKSAKDLKKEVYRITPLIIEQSTGFDRQVFKSFQYVIDSYKQLSTKKRTGLEKYFERDTQMGLNLDWLMRNKFKGEKVIVWAANFHIANNPNKVVSERSWRFKSGNLQTLGNTFEEVSDIETYRIAVTSYGGKYADWGYDKNKHIAIVPQRHNDDSLEKWLANKPIDYAFVPLAPISAKFSLSGFVHKAFHGDWAKVFDAVFYMKEMTPSTYTGSIETTQ